MLLIYNANIHTLDKTHPQASAMLIQGDRILAIGESDQLRNHFASLPLGVKKLTQFDAHNLTIVPGLVDAHIHLEKYAHSLQMVDCETESRQRCIANVAERAANCQNWQWILGHGWNQNNWVDGFGNALELDTVAPQNPVYLTAKSLHAAWGNSRALQLAGIGRDTPDPPNGQIQRDSRGYPTGILFESAMQLVAEIIPHPSPLETATAIQNALPSLWKMGLTGAHDFDGVTCFEALQRLHNQKQLNFRVVKSIPLENLPHAIDLGLSTGFGDDFLRIGNIKIFVDGALGPQTAAMLQPYQGAPDHCGLLIVDAQELFETGRLASQHGLALAVHAIGDRANRECIHGFARLRQSEQVDTPSNSTPLRHRIEHVQLITPQDAARLAHHGIIASMQPIHATSDMLMADRYWAERSNYAYAWRMQLDNGATLVFGSDAPVESPNPFWGIHAAVTRRRIDGTPGVEGWIPAQKITLLEALHAYTTGPAYAGGTENKSGILAPGYFADLLVLADDPFTIKADDLHALQPLATMVAGNWVYQ